MSDKFQAYPDVLVSAVRHDFSQHSYRVVPRQIFVDWTGLISKLARALYPDFSAPALPPTVTFETEMIHSDGPYSASENYYTLDNLFLNLANPDGKGLSIQFESGRHGGGEPLEVSTLGTGSQISSYIDKVKTEAVARIYMFHSDERRAELETIMAQHSASCQDSTPHSMNDFLGRKRSRVSRP